MDRKDEFTRDDRDVERGAADERTGDILGLGSGPIAKGPDDPSTQDQSGVGRAAPQPDARRVRRARDRPDTRPHFWRHQHRHGQWRHRHRHRVTRDTGLAACVRLR